MNITFQTDPGTAIGSFDANYTYANNPNFQNAVNSSCKVGKINRLGSDLFANNQIVLNSKLDFTTRSGFKLKVFSSTTAYNVLLKLEDKTNSTINKEVSRTTTVGANQWEELTFDFASGESEKYDKIILFFQLNSNTTATYFIDDFALYGTGSPALVTTPTTAAPTPPTRADGNVISIFSNAYTNISGIDYNPNWGQTTVTTTIQVAGNSTLKYTGLNYQGTDFSGNAQNVSTMQFLHVDFWTVNSTALNVSVISPGPAEKAKALTVPTNRNWTSVDIPLTDFSPTVELANIIQLKFDGNGDIFLDNIYFHKTAEGGGSGSCPTPPAGEFIVDGGFEANAVCWELIATQLNTSTTIVSNVNNGGIKSARIKTVPGANPGIKQTRFGVGVILPNTTYVVKFDVRQDAADLVAGGAVFKVAAFSEAAEGSGTGAIRHEIISGDGSVPSTWTTKTLTFTTAANAANVAGGISLLIELVGGGASTTGTIYIDNVSLTKQ
ncbi:MAG: hypothetical protein ORN54_08375 [Cyclobacteriaceae bacterium]|nr:hypothetical protein [Cyclobacteriaceae bacterium]